MTLSSLLLLSSDSVLVGDPNDLLKAMERAALESSEYCLHCIASLSQKLAQQYFG